jgi:hypothetical protein
MDTYLGTTLVHYHYYHHDLVVTTALFLEKLVYYKLLKVRLQVRLLELALPRARFLLMLFLLIRTAMYTQRLRLGSILNE